MLPLLLLLLLSNPSLHLTSRFKRLSAYDPANLLLSHKGDDVPKYRIRPFRPKLSVTLAEEARSTKVNGKQVPLWLGDGFVRIPKRPVVSTAQVIPSSAEQNVEVHFGGGPRPHYPYPRVPAPYRPRRIRTTTFPPVMLTLGPGRIPPPRRPFEVETSLVPSRFPKFDRDALIVFKKKKRLHI
ncbi:hypothetical protein Y032_0451g1693 [Ancylostoma ceylanicum]|uniref:Uncharacterized protein n=1 Tax=Ancylostoma ceylanicum TaxID=53326 RepID=A0A016WYT7_9BILA|nr:hypothetical protein Y032_0451g1693 [Ancylostoma ceylanicum]